MEDENVITYETFRKFQRQERDNEGLQKLPEDFFQSCAEWVGRKSKIYEETKDPMALKELENVMAIIKDILDRRERKLLTMATNMVRSNTVPRNLHAHEEKHFDSIVDVLKDMREKILAAIRGGEKSVEKLEKEFFKEVRKAEKEAVKPLSKKPESEIGLCVTEPQVLSDKPKVAEEAPKELASPKITEPEGFRILKFIEDVPHFIGTDDRTCGPFRRDEIATVEEKVAEILVQKGKAEYTA